MRPSFQHSELRCYPSGLDLGPRGCMGWAPDVSPGVASGVFRVPDVVLFGFHFAMFGQTHSKFTNFMAQSLANIQKAISAKTASGPMSNCRPDMPLTPCPLSLFHCPQDSFGELGTTGGGGVPHHPPNPMNPATHHPPPALQDWAKFSCGPLANQISQISLDQRFYNSFHW